MIPSQIDRDDLLRYHKDFTFAEYEAEEDPSIGLPKLVDKVEALSPKYSSA